MSDYTPTTEEVREAYVSLTDFSHRGVEFDRWLIAERKRVATMATGRERARIISLIKEETNETI